LAKYATEYRKGTLTTGEMKKFCIDILQEYVAGYQARRKEVTDEVLAAYMKPRKLVWGGNPNPKKPEPKENDKAEKGSEGKKAEKGGEGKKAKKGGEKKAGASLPIREKSQPEAA
jgi:tryptophanyl-tRNA synthetase